MHIVGTEILSIFTYQVAHTLYSIIIEGMTQCYINVKLSCKTTITQIECMTLLTLQFRVTLSDEHRISVIKIRIQIPDTRPINTHIVSST